MKPYKVYMLESPEGLRYIGLTRQALERRTRKGQAYRQNARLYEDIQRFGWDAFKKRILFSNLDAEIGQQMEIECISKYGTTTPELGYNLEGGGFRKTYISERTREKERCAKLGKKYSAESCRLRSIATKGRPKSEEHKHKIGEGNRKAVRQLTEDFRELNVFSSMDEASKQTNTSVPGISMCCRNKRNFAGGCRWEYALHSGQNKGGAA